MRRNLPLAAMLALAAACEQTVSGPGDQEIGTVDVVLGDRSVAVDLGDLPVVDRGGVEHARLSDVVEAASLEVPLENLEFDFEGSDGFRSSSTSTCVDHIPAPGALLARGYVDLRSRNMDWDEELEMPGCTLVRDLARILASEVGTARTDVEVVYGGRSVLVDLRSLEPVEHDGEEQVPLADIIAWADLGVGLASLQVDLEGGDGYLPSSATACAALLPLPGRDLDGGWVSVATRDLSWDESAEMPGCMAVADLVRVSVEGRPVEGPTVDFTYHGVTVTVDLSEAEVVDFEGTDHVRLGDLLALAELGAEPSALLVDFEADDGFRPAFSTSCEALFPMAGDDLDGGYVELATLDLVWDPVRGLPGCAYIDGLALVDVTDASTGAGPFIDVVHDGSTITVDLSEAEVVTFRGAPHVRLVDVVALAELDVAVESLAFDFVASDGFRASEASTCAGAVPTPGDRIEAGYVELATRDLDWDDAAAMPGCSRVHDLATIEASPL